jgi:hypothetical protein
MEETASDTIGLKIAYNTLPARSEKMTIIPWLPLPDRAGRCAAPPRLLRRNAPTGLRCRDGFDAPRLLGVPASP